MTGVTICNSTNLFRFFASSHVSSPLSKSCFLDLIPVDICHKLTTCQPSIHNAVVGAIATLLATKLISNAASKALKEAQDAADLTRAGAAAVVVDEERQPLLWAQQLVSRSWPFTVLHIPSVRISHTPVYYSSDEVIRSLFPGTHNMQQSAAIISCLDAAESNLEWEIISPAVTKLY